ncbi:MAG: CopG family transcriptional regulator [bacterium]
MTKTITLRTDEQTYDLIKKAADGDRRTISNYIEIATLSYLTTTTLVSDEEMNEILNNKELTKTLTAAKKEIKQGKYTIVA